MDKGSLEQIGFTEEEITDSNCDKRKVTKVNGLTIDKLHTTKKTVFFDEERARRHRMKPTDTERK